MSEQADRGMRVSHVRITRGERIGTMFIYAFILLFALFCLLPFVMVIIVSLTEEKSITLNGYSFFPKAWSIAAYRMMFGKSSSVPRSYLVTTTATVIGTLVGSVITFGAGYTLVSNVFFLVLIECYNQLFFQILHS